jgi:hypothetical protein
MLGGGINSFWPGQREAKLLPQSLARCMFSTLWSINSLAVRRALLSIRPLREEFVFSAESISTTVRLYTPVSDAGPTEAFWHQGVEVSRHLRQEDRYNLSRVAFEFTVAL